jgi:hypothetical protein
MIDLILRVADSLTGLASQIRNVRRDRRDRIAVLLTDIADCIADIAASYRSDARYVPYSRCVELRAYFRNLEEIIRHTIAAEEVKPLLAQIERAIHGRLTLQLQLESALMGYGYDANKALRDLDAANGSFRATANLLKAS